MGSYGRVVYTIETESTQQILENHSFMLTSVINIMHEKISERVILAKESIKDQVINLSINSRTCHIPQVTTPRYERRSGNPSSAWIEHTMESPEGSAKDLDLMKQDSEGREFEMTEERSLELQSNRKGTILTNPLPKLSYTKLSIVIQILLLLVIFWNTLTIEIEKNTVSKRIFLIV